MKIGCCRNCNDYTKNEKEMEEVEKLGTRYFNIVLDPSPMDILYYQSSITRASIHNRLTEILDVDREMIESLIEKVRNENYRPEPFGLNLDRAYADFIKGLKELAELPIEKRRDCFDTSQIPTNCLEGIPSMKSNEEA